MGKYVILGHENPDVDSVVSGYLLNKLLNVWGLDSEFIIPDKKIEQETVDICMQYGLNPYQFQKDINSYRGSEFILVDHNERDVPGNIYMVVDHHPLKRKENILYLCDENASSTSCLILQNDEDCFSREDIELAVMATFVDTASFHSTKSRESDKDLIYSICELFGFDYEKLYRTGLCLTDLKDLESASFNGLKRYNFNGHLVESSYVQIGDVVNNQDKIDEMLSIIYKHVLDDNLDVFAFIVHDMDLFKSSVYEITKDECIIVEYSQYTSRGNTIIPELANEIERKNREKIFIGCSSRDNIDSKYLELAKNLSTKIAKEGYGLVFGAASFGMMGKCYESFLEENQPICSYTVSKYKDDLNNLQSDNEEVLSTTFERSAKAYQDSSHVVFLPGGTGTISEFFSILEENRTTDNPKKVILYNYDGYYDKVLDVIDYCIVKQFNDSNIYNYFTVANSDEEVLRQISNKDKVKLKKN